MDSNVKYFLYEPEDDLVYVGGYFWLSLSDLRLQDPEEIVVPTSGTLYTDHHVLCEGVLNLPLPLDEGRSGDEGATAGEILQAVYEYKKKVLATWSEDEQVQSRWIIRSRYV